VQLLADLDGDAAAQSTADVILSREPEHAGAAFVRGRHLLAQDDAAGLPWLDRAMQRNPRFTEPCVALIQAYHARAGSPARARQSERHLDEYQPQMALAARERAVVTAKDCFVSPDLCESARTELSKVFAAEPDITRVWVTRKVVMALPDEPMYVIALETRNSWWKFRRQQASQLLVRRVLDRVELSGYVYVFTIGGNLKSLRKKIAGMPESLVFARPK
jgi:hypothetical protein